MILQKKHLSAIGFVLLLFSIPACHTPEKPHAESFEHWIGAFKTEALSKGISPAVIARAFEGIEAPDENSIELDHKQPEKTKLFDEYKNGIITPEKIDEAKAQWQSHKELLDRIEKQYGVPAPILLALWGVESHFGTRQGTHNIIEALATLAYDGRRSQFFRDELFNALQILQNEHMESAMLTGSWAGAMGQVQFMPSSYLKFATDFDGDGKKDIWNSDADALASMANYLHQKGWNPRENWGMVVSLPNGNIAYWQTMKGEHSLREWQKLGLRTARGKALAQSDARARLVIPDDDHVSAFLVFYNYDVIMDWNRSIYFATSVDFLPMRLSAHEKNSIYRLLRLTHFCFGLY